MLIPRVIPCLLFDDGAMIKTRRFNKRTYLGDPVNVINLFNQFEVDEIALFDIGASVNQREPDFDIIEQMAEECWVPLTYGGGIQTLHHIERIILSGVEKVALGNASTDLTFVTRAANEFGTQCIVGSVDVRKKFWGGYDVCVCSGKKQLKINPTDRVKQLEEAGAGEIFLQFINHDGEMNGYDLDLIEQVCDATDLPVIACSGARQRQDLLAPIQRGASASAAGSLFVFSGEERGVLINFPEREELENLLKDAADDIHTI